MEMSIVMSILSWTVKVWPLGSKMRLFNSSLTVRLRKEIRRIILKIMIVFSFEILLRTIMLSHLY